MRDYEIYKKLDSILLVRNKLLNGFEIANKESMQFLETIDNCLNQMGDEYLFILQMSYFKCSYKFWWLDYYCKSSYYRKRFFAVKSFVSLFEMMYENFNANSNSFNFVN